MKSPKMELASIDTTWYSVAPGSEIMSRFHAPASQRKKMIFTSMGQPEPPSSPLEPPRVSSYERHQIASASYATMTRSAAGDLPAEEEEINTPLATKSASRR